jgi:hypothetical protein
LISALGFGVWLVAPNLGVIAKLPDARRLATMLKP